MLVSAKSMPEALMSRTVTPGLLMLVSVAVLSGLSVPKLDFDPQPVGGISLTTFEAFAFNTRKTQSITIRHEFTLSSWPPA